VLAEEEYDEEEIEYAEEGVRDAPRVPVELFGPVDVRGGVGEEAREGDRFEEVVCRVVYGFELNSRQ
jgi:hypothetical protein